MMKQVKADRGFTLFELMIVVAVIGLLAAIVIPNIMRARIAVNEKLIARALKTFLAANESYRATQGPPRYAGTIADLTNATPHYLDSRWLSTEMNGYRMSEMYYERTDDTFSFVAIPIERMVTAENDYCIEHTGKMISSDNQYIVSSTAGCSGGTVV